MTTPRKPRKIEQRVQPVIFSVSDSPLLPSVIAKLQEVVDLDPGAVQSIQAAARRYLATEVEQDMVASRSDLQHDLKLLTEAALEVSMRLPDGNQTSSRLKEAARAIGKDYDRIREALTTEAGDLAQVAIHARKTLHPARTNPGKPGRDALVRELLAVCAARGWDAIARDHILNVVADHLKLDLPHRLPFL